MIGTLASVREWVRDQVRELRAAIASAVAPR